MDKGEDWIEGLLQVKAEDNSSVTKSVRIHIKSLIRGKMRERLLRSEELSDIARALINNINFKEPNQEKEDEN